MEMPILQGGNNMLKEKLLEDFYIESRDDINELRLSLVHLPKNFQDYYNKMYSSSLWFFIN